MTLEELNEIERQAKQSDRAGQNLISTKNEIAGLRKVANESTTFCVADCIARMSSYHPGDARKQIDAALKKYFPDICREIELQLEAEARAHSNQAKILRAQVKAFFNEQQEVAP